MRVLLASFFGVICPSLVLLKRPSLPLSAVATYGVTKSPLASEALALSEAADAGFLASAMLQEIFQLRKLPPVTCKTDNSSLVQTLNSSNIVADKRLRVDISRLKEMMVKEEIKVEWIEGFKQVADVMTKAGASSELLRDILNHH